MPADPADAGHWGSTVAQVAALSPALPMTTASASQDRPAAASRSATRDHADRAGRSRLSALRRLWPYLKPYRGRVGLTLIVLTVAALTVLGFGWGLRILVDGGFADGGSPDLLNRALGVLLAAVLVLAGATFGRFYLVSWLGERLVADLRRDVYDHVLSLSPGWFETTRTAEIVSRLTADVTVVQVTVSATGSRFLRDMLLIVGGLVMMATTSVKLTALAAGVIPLVLIPILVFGRRVRHLSRGAQDRVADVSVQVEETLSAVRTVQAFTQEPREKARLAGAVEAAFDAARHRILARAALTATVILLVFGAIGGILWVGGHDVLAGRLTAGELSAFIFFAVLTAGAAGAMSEIIGDLQRAAGATERLFDLLDEPATITAPASPARLPTPPRGAVTLSQVGFTYPSRPDRPALTGIDLAVAPGETVAIVGPSGAGKSTLFALLLRYYEASAGRIALDRVDIRDLDPTDLRRQIALVPQDPVIFSGSAADNIAYGRPEASPAAIREAAAAAQALAFVDALPDGFDTPLGEKGVRLSGGQRQRIAIARAILKDAPILLLDEATSSLDSESEQAVQTALETLMRGRTTLVIAHRLATVRAADRIVVLDQGRLVEVGSHDALQAAGGLYARLAALQFRDGAAA